VVQFRLLFVYSPKSLAASVKWLNGRRTVLQYVWLILTTFLSAICQFFQITLC